MHSITHQLLIHCLVSAPRYRTSNRSYRYTEQSVCPWLAQFGYCSILCSVCVYRQEKPDCPTECVWSEAAGGQPAVPEETREGHSWCLVAVWWWRWACEKEKCSSLVEDVKGEQLIVRVSFLDLFGVFCQVWPCSSRTCWPTRNDGRTARSVSSLEARSIGLITTAEREYTVLFLSEV